MKQKILFVVSSIYLLFGGLGYVFQPVQSVMGVISPAAIDGILYVFRGYGITLIAIAVMNFLARNQAPSKAMQAIITGNSIGFGLGSVSYYYALSYGASTDIWYLFGIESFLGVCFLFAPFCQSSYFI